MPSSPSEEEKEICRFCLSSKITRTNPLIAPCDCKGSLRSVHVLCLQKWLRINPSRNTTSCELCLKPYLITSHPEREIIPENHTYTIFILRHPFTLSVGIHYIWILHLSFENPKIQELIMDRFLYLCYQTAFQILYGALFMKAWDVRNRRAYWEEWKKMRGVLCFAFYIFLIGCLCKDYYVAGPILNFYVAFFWQYHILSLKSINERLDVP